MWCLQYAWSIMSVLMNEAAKVKNWPIIVDYSSHIQLWLINLLFLGAPHNKRNKE